MRQESDPSSENTFDNTDDRETHELATRLPESFGHRHGLKVLGVILATMFATVILVQTAC